MSSVWRTGESELRLEDEARQAKAAAEEASQKAEKGRVDVRRMKGFLQEAKEVIEKQQSQIKKLQRDKAGGAVAAQGLQAEQLHGQLALVREQLASKEFELKELKVRIPPSPFVHLILCASQLRSLLLLCRGVLFRACGGLSGGGGAGRPRRRGSWIP